MRIADFSASALIVFSKHASFLDFFITTALGDLTLWSKWADGERHAIP